MAIRVPSLSPSGWTEDIAVRADKLLGYFLVSEESQSNMYRGEIASLPAIVKKNNSNKVGLRDEVEKRLGDMLERYFERATVEVNVTENNQEGKYGWNIEITANMVEGGVTYSLGRLVSTLNASVMKIVEINNGD